MAVVARISGGHEESKLIVHREPLSPISESYRLLRTNIRFSVVDKPLFTLMVTSAGPSEGKSVTLSNLAVALAESGKKVLVIDTDLRRPTLHHLFESPNAAGLSDAILNVNTSVMEYVQQTLIPNLYLLSAGPIPPNPAELLASERMGHLLEELRQHMDVVLLDSPPALVVADAFILGARVDATLLVTDLGQTRRPMARRVAEELRRVGANPAGVVLNRVGPGGAGYNFSYQYYYAEGSDGKWAGRSKKRKQSDPIASAPGQFHRID
ncbi:MAG: CpsD/CapB family tyrosine-protein kinase [Chloroflexi bacterium]|nr:CpsD/CapB family tyrosine-protein kinase [Chloroflexota bacterium]